MQPVNPLLAISPLDGRYAEKVDILRNSCSEFGLIKARIQVEITWVMTLIESSYFSELKDINETAIEYFNHIAEHFSLNDAARIKEIESTTNHDVKACEYFIKEKIESHAILNNIAEFVHFGLTSEDVNNLAYNLMLLKSREIILEQLNELLIFITKFAHIYCDVSMLSRTHGQPATPTTLGKEFANVAARLKRQLSTLTEAVLLGKLNGATGNYNALVIAYPHIDWQIMSQRLVEKLGLTWNPFTTQIEPHDALAEWFHTYSRINTILIDFSRDIWGYISLNYFTQQLKENEVGSSTMPHKINPIDFENAEGNLGIANALFHFFAEKLPVSRFQRDLSDSTVLRNIGVALAHSYLAYQTLLKGLKKLSPNTALITDDLNQHWEVLAEPIQTVMRRYQIEAPYEKLKAFTRGKIINQKMLNEFILSTSLPVEVKNDLLRLKPADYIGLAIELAKTI